MRDNKSTPSQSKSKGFGFLSFSRHEDALTVLRKLNNNPDIFSANHRPILSFSIEDMNVLKIKERRKVRSMLNNPTYQEKMKIKKLKNKTKKENKSLEKKDVKDVKKKVVAQPENEESQFSGFAAKPGKVPKLRGTHKLKEQSKIHEKTMKTHNKHVRRQKHLSEVEHEKKSNQFEKTIKKGKVNEKDSLVAKINKYKDLLKASNEGKKKKSKKWYVE